MTFPVRLLAVALGSHCVPYVGEDAEFDQAFQLGAGAFDVLRRQFVVEGFADVPGPQRADRAVEGLATVAPALPVVFPVTH